MKYVMFDVALVCLFIPLTENANYSRSHKILDVIIDLETKQKHNLQIVDVFTHRGTRQRRQRRHGLNYKQNYYTCFFYIYTLLYVFEIHRAHTQSFKNCLNYVVEYNLLKLLKRHVLSQVFSKVKIEILKNNLFVPIECTFLSETLK